ncbi:hypothetical protein A6E01_17265 [Vibrio breoganii]|uniref:Sulfotransferase family protein n=1 Tax=Vibrio breoganii TaxID=553239 RepID=A0AAN0XYH4_9VIBR|nr:sulfotransferase family 2 domain-containing protein [Vibrio breoganii]ANO34933.1 hypothetical protein A6E01_17265 [Vibrio breoganii]
MLIGKVARLIFGKYNVMYLMAIKQRIKRISGKPNIYSYSFDLNRSIFIHVPKTAGTSICHSLYGNISWPWHFNARQCRLIDKKAFDSYLKFTFVRDPFERLVSTYNYAQTHAKNNPNSSINFILSYNNFDEFVLDWVNKKNINTHYFFNTQLSYITDEKGIIIIDKVFRFESINHDFKLLSEMVDIKSELKERNISKHTIAKKFTQEAIDRVYEVYLDDYDAFGYEKYKN